MVPRTEPKRVLLLTAVAGVLGLAGGGAAWVLLHLIGLITSIAVFGHADFHPPAFATLQPSLRLVIVAVIGALLISVLARWAPIIRGHGIPEAMEAVLTRESRISPRTAIAKPLSAALTIGTAAPFGAEGPIIVTGGALGSLIGQVIRVSPAERKILLACGAAAGMSATFGAPLAAVVLAVELLLFEFSARALVPLVVAASVAGAVHAGLFGSGPLFVVPGHHYAGLGVLPAFALLGVACGLLTVVITRDLFFVEALYRRLPVKEFWHPAIGAVGFATVGLVVPRALGVGYDAISDVLDARLALATVAALGAAKLIAWWLTLGSGTSGGTLAPVLLISASFGTLIGVGLNNALPGPDVAPGAFALVAMAATFGAATRASFATIVFVFELTRDYQVVVPLMLATVLADLVFDSLSEHSLMTEKLHRRGLHIGRHFGVDPFTTTSVGSIMSTDIEALPPNADSAATVSPDDRAVVALHLMIDEGVDQLLVVDGDTVVGSCTLGDLLKVRAHQLGLERTQPGLRLRRRGMPDPPKG